MPLVNHACSTAQEFSDFLLFLNRCKGDLGDMEEAAQAIHAFYYMLRIQDVPVSELQTAQYQMLNLDMEKLKLALARAEDDKDKHIVIFEGDLKQDVAALVEKIESAKREVSMEYILDSAHIGNEAAVIELTGNILVTVRGIAEDASRIRRYQRLFELEVMLHP